MLIFVEKYADDHIIRLFLTKKKKHTCISAVSNENIKRVVIRMNMLMDRCELNANQLFTNTHSCAYDSEIRYIFLFFSIRLFRCDVQYLKFLMVALDLNLSKIDFSLLLRIIYYSRIVLLLTKAWKLKKLKTI